MRLKTSSGKAIKWHESPNKWGSSNSKVEPISCVVIHYTGSADGLAGDIAWCINPDSQVSYHYMIDQTGRIVQLVDDKDRAWHAGRSEFDGRSGVNKFSIGVSLDGTSGTEWPQLQLDSLADLCYDLMKDHNLEMGDFVGHEDVSPGRKFDPGPSFDWEKFRRMLRQRVDPTSIKTIDTGSSAHADDVVKHCCCDCQCKQDKTS